jgi:hypothetical protein
VTEGTGHVIDPAGDARRALQEAVTTHGPGALSDATVMDNLCRTQLTALPGECILIVSAARADVPALLRDNIPQLGTYGAIQSVATTLAGAHDLDNAASLWVVREFARALGLVAPGGTQSIPRPAPDGLGTGGTGGTGAPAGSAGGTGVPGGAGVPAGSGVPGGPGGPEYTPGMAGAPQPGMAGAPPGMAAGSQPGMAGGPPGVAGGSQPGMAGGPPGMAGAGGPARRGSSGSKLLNRNTVGIAAAIALVAGYLGVAAAAHLSPFPAKTVSATSSQSQSQSPSTGPSTSPGTSPATSPAESPDASPTSDYDVLLSKIPQSIRSQSSCPNAGTQFGAIAVSQCNRLNLAARTIQYYLYPSAAALTSGVSQFLSSAHFRKQRECTSGSDFTDFLVECQSDFHNQTPFMTGTIAEYISKDNDPIIVSTDKQENVMAILVGTNAGDLLAYWKQLEWIKD